jgi:hypothetical protein
MAGKIRLRSIEVLWWGGVAIVVENYLWRSLRYDEVI